MRNLVSRLALGAVLFAIPLVGQSAATPAAAPPHFEVASIKPTGRPGNGAIPPIRSGRWIAGNVTASALIARAYSLHCCKLVEGGPKWLTQAGFRIGATVATKTVPEAEFRLMLQQLLLNRFQLKMHMVTRDEPAYLIEVAPSGSKLRPAAAPCDPSAGFIATSAATPPRCGLSQRSTQDRDEFILVGRSTTMSELALAFEGLALPEPHAVVDRTGLTGKFDFDLTYHLLGRVIGGRGMDDPEVLHDNMAAFAKEVRAQLGLNFDPFHTHKVPLPVVVVDSIAMPSN